MNNRFNSIRSYLEQQRSQSTASNDTNADENTPILVNVSNEAEEDQVIDYSQLSSQEIAMLHNSDPFSYHSIRMARQGTAFCDLDGIQQGAPSEGDNAAGGGTNTNQYNRNENHSFHGVTPSRTRIVMPRRAMRRFSMPNLEAKTIQGPHRIPAPTTVRRRRRIATEVDACTAMWQLLGGPTNP